MKLRNLKQVSDEKLAILLREDGGKVLDEIFDRYWEKLFRYANKIVMNEDAAKDVVQEVFVKLWERRQTLMVRNLNAYLIQATKYRIASHLRRQRLNERHEGVIESLVFVNSTEQLINLKELNETILASLKDAPHRSKEVFYLSRYEQLSNKEIATKLDISIRTVETHISKVLKHLRKNLKTSTLLLLLLFLSQALLR